MEQQTILVPLNSGEDREVRATLCGRFAVHRSIDNRNLYSVTHIASGFAAITTAESEAAGVRLARRLTRCGINWDFTVPPKRLIGCKRGKAIVGRWRASEAALTSSATARHAA
jgi:hypothetical protein